VHGAICELFHTSRGIHSYRNKVILMSVNDLVLHTFLVESSDIILDKNWYPMECTPPSFELTFRIKRSSLRQPLRVRFNNRMETWALMVDFQNSRNVRLPMQ
jgi:hypothetical protein